MVVVKGIPSAALNRFVSFSSSSSSSSSLWERRCHIARQAVADPREAFGKKGRCPARCRAKPFPPPPSSSSRRQRR